MADSPIPGLSAHHYNELHVGSGLSTKTIRNAGFRTSTDPAEIARILNWRQPAAALGSCLVIPFRQLDGSFNEFARIRPDNPRSDGKGGVIKYDQPRGCSPRAYFPGTGLPGKLILEHARQKYAESRATGEKLETKAADLMRTAGVLATIVLAASKVFEIGLVYPVRISVVLLLAAMAAAIWARHPIFRTSLADVPRIAEDAATSANPEAWLAGSLSDTIEGQRVADHWCAWRIIAAEILTWLGIASLVPLAWSV